MLAQALAIAPETIMHVSNLYEQYGTMFSSLLARRGLTMKGLYAGADMGNFKIVGNRQIKWPLKGLDNRKGRIVTAVTGTPGIGNTIFDIVVDTDWFDENEVLELWDRRTLLFVVKRVQTGESLWTLSVRIVTNDALVFVDPALLVVGAEIGLGHSAYPELSEDGNEKLTLPEWHTEFMTIQRVKWTLSGSVEASDLVIEHGGQKFWEPFQSIQNMRRFMLMREHQLIFGRSTVDPNTSQVMVSDKWGRDIMTGNGLLAQGDPALKFVYNDLSIRWLDNVMNNLQLQTIDEENTELVVMGGQAFLTQFQQLMTNVLRLNPEPLVVRDSDGRGIDTTFKWYRHNGVKIIPIWLRYLDRADAPTQYDSWGVSYSSRQGIFVNLGNTIGGNPNIKLLALGNDKADRTFVQRVISGMTGGRSKSGRIEAASSVDGKQVHTLCESGLAVMNPRAIAEAFPTRRP